MKKWLRSNKIYFETVAASLLSFMAVIVSLSQARTASKQTELLAIQTKVAEAQASAQFEVQMQPKLNDATGKFDDYSLVVYNRGGMVEGFDAQAAVFLHIEASGAGLITLKADVPVNDYFTVNYISAAGTGELVSMVGNHNNATVVKLTNDLRAVAHTSEPLHFANLSEQIIVRLRYRDLLGRRREDFYQARFIGGGSRVPDDVGRAKLTMWEQANRLQLSGMSAETLLALAKPSK